MGACNSNGATARKPAIVNTAPQPKIAGPRGEGSPVTPQVNTAPQTKIAGPRVEGSPATPQATRLDHARFITTRSVSVRELYDLEEAGTLGKGGFGSVRMCACKSTGKPYAVKSVPKVDHKGYDPLSQEAANMRLMEHPNIIKLFSICEDSQQCNLVMELCTGGDLSHNIVRKTRFHECEAAIVMDQLLQAVGYMHQRNICHRDLKPQNIVFKTHGSSSVLKLIDFGFSCKCGPGTTLTKVLGTPSYMAPEVLAKQYDERCDLWSSGAILYTMLCGHPPFRGNSAREILAKVQKGRYNFTQRVWQEVTPDAKVVIRKLMAVSPDQRYTAEQGLGDEWIRRNVRGWKSVPMLRPDLLENLREFKALSWFKKAVLYVLAREMSDEETEGLLDLFRRLDSDNDGTLNLGELKHGVLTAGLSEAAPDIKEIVEGLDIDGNGSVDCTEFVAAALDRESYLKRDLCLAAFNVFDLDLDGKITLQELREVFGTGSSEHEMPAALLELLPGLDEAGDGAISFEDFMSMMARP